MLMSTEVVADKKTAWIIAYITIGHILELLITAGELDIVLSPMALSWLSETEYFRFEALVDEVEWTASLQDRVVALPELPLDLDLFLSFLDKKVGGFTAQPPRGVSGFIFTDGHIRHLQKLRVAQQDAFEVAEFIQNFKAVDDRLEAEFLDFARKADVILESKKER